MIDPLNKTEMLAMAAQLKMVGITPETLETMRALNDPFVRARADLEAKANPLIQQIELIKHANALTDVAMPFGLDLKATANSIQFAEEALARERRLDPFGTIRTVAAMEEQRADHREKLLGLPLVAGDTATQRDFLEGINDSPIEFTPNPAIQHMVQEARERTEREIESLDLARRLTQASEAAIRSAQNGEAVANAREAASTLREQASAARADRANRLTFIGLLIGLAGTALAAWQFIAPRLE